jgi:PKD repeat protein
LPPTLSLSEPQISGSTVTVDGIVTPGYSGASITMVLWEWGDGSKEDEWFPASHIYASHTYRIPGTYTITVTVHQSDGLSTKAVVSLQITSIDFNIIYEGQQYKVSIKVPLEKFNDAKQKIGNLYGEYPDIYPPQKMLGIFTFIR